jgi:hypothetical protein
MDGRFTDAEVVALTRRLFDAPRIFIICNLYGSAGSYFLLTLFDRHPDVWTLMFDVRRIPIFVDDFDAHTREQHLAAILLNNERLFDTRVPRDHMNTLCQLGDTRDQGVVTDRETFRHYLMLILDQVPFNIRNLCLATCVAHNLARGVCPSTNTFVLYAHDLPRTKLFIDQFGCGRIIALARHPVSTHASRCTRLLREHEDYAAEPTPDCRKTLVVALYRPSHILYLEDMYRLLPDIREPVGVVMIEQLHADPKASMQRIAEFVGIRFVSTLLESTVAGLKWWGSHYTRLYGFSAVLHRDVPVATAGRNDVAALGRATARLQAHLGYRTPSGRVDAFRSKLPGIRYPVDVATLTTTLVRRNPSIATAARCTRFTLERVAKYVVGRATVENRALGSLAALDRRADFSGLVALNPLAPATMRWEVPEKSFEVW